MMLQSSTIRQRKAPPPGIYDQAGNILSKTVAGKTTTYTYDKANQLVSSTTANGKVTKYEYDAAGRMVKEGEKTFAYGWLDKVMQVAENGKTTQTYTYDMLGQLATADYGDSRETFLWDGLALLSRNNLKYVNEPAMTGGNPILAGDKMLFDDMLGNTLGVKDGEKFSAIDRDAFGELKPGEKPNLAVNFFTGKPEIDGLGYSFLFRNYRADLGKWQTTDPLGYPDGWNNLAYCNNASTVAFDSLGLAQGYCIDYVPTGNYDPYTGYPITTPTIVTCSKSKWDNFDFTAHYFVGNGAERTLSSMGLENAVWKVIEKSVLYRKGGLEDQLNELARSAVDTSYKTGSVTLPTYNTRNTYDFSEASWPIRKATLMTASRISVSWSFDEGRQVFDYTFTGGIDFTFHDVFSDPADLDSFGLDRIDFPYSNPFIITESWSVTTSGNGYIE